MKADLHSWLKVCFHSLMNKSYSYEEAIRHFGTPAEMARRLGIKPQAIYQWGREIPDLRQYQVDQVINSDLAGPGVVPEETAA